MKLLKILLEVYKEEFDVNLKEGLIKSQNIDVTINLLKKFHGNHFSSFKDYKGISAVSENTTSEKVNSELVKTANNMGWFPSFMVTKDYTGKWNPDVFKKGRIEVRFEAKYDDQIVDKIPDYLYHVAPKKNADKIEKIGLVPKSRSKLSFHPERVYLAKTEKDTDELAGLFYETSGDRDYGVFKINTQMIPGGYFKLYKDPNYSKGFYTVNNIPPKAIERMDDIRIYTSEEE